MDTKRLWQLYSPELPDFLEDAAQTAPMQRLKKVGMNCGCEYTSFLRFREQARYTRYAHSLGVALIVWHFTRDKAQALAGLLHDVATPVFAHVIDFVRGDYMTQEATEAGTSDIIAAAEDLQEVLHKNGLTTAHVEDYHRYCVADNDAPRLSADRLEYSLGNMLHYGICPIADVERYYRDLTLTKNEEGAEEIAFTHRETALHFARGALACSKIYVSDEDRYAMQMLAELIRDAVEMGILAEKDLYLTEPTVIAKLTAVPDFAARWQDFRALSIMETCTGEPTGDGWRMVPAKKRRIDPLVLGQGRVSLLSPDFAAELEKFRTQPQNYWVRGVK